MTAEPRAAAYQADPAVSVVIPTHNPDRGRLLRTLAGLRAQTLPAGTWETILVDNASSPPVDPSPLADSAPGNLRVVREGALGLTAARRRGLGEARAPLVVLVDDDNVLAPDYLAQVVRLFGENERVGALGGRSLPEFEREPLAWERTFLDLLAVRDPGDAPHVSRGLRPDGAAQNEYPVNSAPIGAGMALRAAAARGWLDADESAISDRRGGELTSGGDNDIVLTVMEHGWEVGYFPELSLVHLIPAKRLEPLYLARLNRGIQKSWMHVLTKHTANPWPPIPGWTLPLRKVKAWFKHRAWSGTAANIRWQGACGHFEGRVKPSTPPPPLAS